MKISNTWTGLTLAVAAVFVCHGMLTEAAVVDQIDALKAQFLPAEYRNTNITVDNVKKIFQEKCKKVSGVDNSTLYKDIEKGAATMMTCFSGLFNMSNFQTEIEIARPIGELDTVFHDYCSKAPQAEKCVRDFNSKLQPCLSAEELKQNAVLMRVGSSLLAFMCARGGNQVALFVAEEGPECIEANKEDISHCMNSSFSEFVPKNGGQMPNLFDLPELVMQPEHCVDFEAFEACTLHHLQQCREITAANVAESVFKLIKNETSCKSWIDAKSNERPVLMDSRDNGCAGTFLHLSLLWACLVALLALKFISNV